MVATQATWWQGKALAAGRNIHASLYARIAAGAENPTMAATATRSRW
ncbi:fatty-acid synthase domain protein [Mycobacterium xenopi 4042]|uniref:Fatty-acid synthase domain protein n=1 Tax=Mycobacterium xenopi 4042 TaxID=1299334 RepID=X7YVC8_MYCXE|nr:fatty-acid synthase domain protein [Mycobacterium xenopi 4042]